MRRAYKYRLYPNKNQRRELDAMLETHRRLYNYCLDMRQLAYQVYGATISFKDQRKWYTTIWRDHPYYSRLKSNAADETIRRLDLAFQAFFRRIKEGDKPGFPRFKGRNRFDTVKFGTYPNGLKLIDDRIKVQHVGSIKVKLHRPVMGKIKIAWLKREADKWYVIFSTDLGPSFAEPSKNPEVGIDVGISAFVATSDGEKIANPRYLKTTLPKLRRVGRALARKKRGGRNRRKARKVLAVVHAHLANQRRDQHHKVANDLVSRFGFIAAERLDIRGLVKLQETEPKTRRLTRSILDVAWGNFLGTVRYKAESAGVAFVEVEPRGTSQGCSGCGAIVPKTLRDRTHRCPHCGLVLDRDVNAARNILTRGRLARLGPVEANVAQQGVRSPRSSSRQPGNQAPAKKPASRSRKSGGP